MNCGRMYSPMRREVFPLSVKLSPNATIPFKACAEEMGSPAKPKPRRAVNVDLEKLFNFKCQLLV